MRPSPGRLERNPFVKLLCNALGRRAVSGMERSIVTERAPAVRTREPRIHDQLQSRFFRRKIACSGPFHASKLRNIKDKRVILKFFSYL